MLFHNSCRNAVKNVKFSQALREVISEAGVEAGCSKQAGSLLYTIASKVKSLDHYISLVILLVKALTVIYYRG